MIFNNLWIGFVLLCILAAAALIVLKEAGPYLQVFIGGLLS